MAQQVWVILSAAEREQLAAIAADRNRPRKHVERARIVLASADSQSPQQVARSVGVSRPTVWRWQQRFAESGVEGLLRDKTRKPGKAPIAAEITAQVVALTCTEPPHQATHWTGRMILNRSLLLVEKVVRPLDQGDERIEEARSSGAESRLAGAGRRSHEEFPPGASPGTEMDVPRRLQRERGSL
jgi:hypothetical protein